LNGCACSSSRPANSIVVHSLVSRIPLAFQALRHRFLWRKRAPIGPGEVRRIERWLATARVFLAVSALVAIRMDPGEIDYSFWAYGLLAFYIAQGVIVILLLRRREQSTVSFRRLVHAGDIVWPALISIFATGLANPFFLFFVFVLAAAAYRWGLWETVTTAATAVCLLWIESLAFYLGFFKWVDSQLLRIHLPSLQVQPINFEPKRLFMLSIYLVVMGLLLGYLAEQQKQLRSEKAVIARILGKVRVEAGLGGTLQEIVGELLVMYGANRALIASQDVDGKRVYVGEMQLRNSEPSFFRWLEPRPSDRETYLFKSPVETSYIWHNGHQAKSDYTLLGLDHAGLRVPDASADSLNNLATQHPFAELMTVSFIFGQEWQGRIFLLDPSLTGEMTEELRFLQELVRQIGPAVYNVYLLRRLRLRAGALERARFARELHDGAVQSLIAVEMQVDVLRRQSATHVEIVPEELGRIQGLLREEVLKLRELMQQMKSLDIDSRRLIGFLVDTVERFQRETGIAARFSSDLEQPDMPQPVCRELTRIVQEGLVNVRKHSRAHAVLVRLSAANGRWTLVIEDDGRGFPFSGRLSQTELDSLGRGPLVIKERVRIIAGELAIESTPGQGSRLEISVPQKPEAAYG
jgi:signal transduction histidine kinase